MMEKKLLLFVILNCAAFDIYAQFMSSAYMDSYQFEKMFPELSTQQMIYAPYPDGAIDILLQPDYVKQIEKEHKKELQSMKKLFSLNTDAKGSKISKPMVKYFLVFVDFYKHKNDTAILVKCYLKADSLVMKQPEILKDEQVKTVHSNVLYNLGTLYFEGKYVVKNRDKAFSYLNRADSLGNPWAKRILYIERKMDTLSRQKNK